MSHSPLTVLSRRPVSEMRQTIFWALARGEGGSDLSQRTGCRGRGSVTGLTGTGVIRGSGFLAPATTCVASSGEDAVLAP